MQRTILLVDDYEEYIIKMAEINCKVYLGQLFGTGHTKSEGTAEEFTEQ